MGKLNKYKKELRGMFYMSVDSDIKNWTQEWSDTYKSVSYKGNQFKLIYSNSRLIVVSEGVTILICKYKWKFIPTHLKVWLYLWKLHIHFYKIQNNNWKLTRDRNNEMEAEKMKKITDSFSGAFTKQIRKNKLKKLG